MSKPIEFHSSSTEQVFYVCGCCRTIHQGRETADSCCICRRCNEQPIRSDHGQMFCQGCAPIERAEREAERMAKLLALPVVTDHAGPVYLDPADRYFADVNAAAEAVWDDGDDPTTVIAHPCTIVRLPVPDLHTYVQETWGEHFEDDLHDELAKGAAVVLDRAVKELTAHAPEAWEPNLKVRLVLPAMEATTR